MLACIRQQIGPLADVSDSGAFAKSSGASQPASVRGSNAGPANEAKDYWVKLFRYFSWQTGDPSVDLVGVIL